MPQVLVVDDDATTRLLVGRRLERSGFGVQTASTAADALAAVQNGFRGVIVLDLMLPDRDGRELLPELRDLQPDNPVVILTSHGTADAALDSLSEGAFDFLDKATLAERLLPTVRSAAETLRADGVDADGNSDYGFKGIIARSPEMRAVRRSLENALESRVPVMIRGESGTGKELIARAVHDNGPRRGGPFVAVNCAAIPENLLEAELFGYERGAFTGAVGRKQGRFELAQGGTLMLDEIGELHPHLQAKLLRVLQNGEYQRLGGTQTLIADVRIISATHRVLETEVEAGRFREDLYYRMAVFTVQLPPLRERTGDLPLLIRYFLTAAAEREGKKLVGVDPLARELLESYSYPGNVRELQNVIAYAAVSARGSVVAMSDLPVSFLRAVSMERRKAGQNHANMVVDSSESSAKTASMAPVQHESVLFPTLARVEQQHVQRALERAGGNKAAAARLLGISRMTLYRKLEAIDDLS
ncbi:MAG: sigma-54-dependent Fis family transcriptional regulator [Oligoflexia bacterium]|nr:sigma-54-dependent Fis family transcriptional regulator [Oligoflexia bacterium]